MQNELAKQTEGVVSRPIIQHGHDLHGVYTRARGIIKVRDNLRGLLYPAEVRSAPERVVLAGFHGMEEGVLI